MKPERTVTLSAPMRLQAGFRYPPMEVRIAEDFAYTQQEMVGPAFAYLAAVYAPPGAHGIELPFLRVVGYPTWNPRLSQASGTNLWELAGLGLYGSLGTRIGYLEVDGLPRGLVADGAAGWSLDSAYLRRCWKPLDGRFNVTGGISPAGFSIRNVVQVDGRLDRGMDPGNQWRSKTARIESDLTSGKAGSYITGENFVIDGLVQHGDSFGVKTAGSRYVLRNLHAAHVFASGVYPPNRTTYPGTEYRHLHESRDVMLEDFRLVGSVASTIDHVLLRVSYPFQPRLLVRRGVFVKGGQATHAGQVNWATVQLEDCDLIGWQDASAAFELGPAGQGMPAASLITKNCRFWAS